MRSTTRAAQPFPNARPSATWASPPTSRTRRATWSGSGRPCPAADASALEHACPCGQRPRSSPQSSTWSRGVRFQPRSRTGSARARPHGRAPRRRSVPSGMTHTGVQSWASTSAAISSRSAGSATTNLNTARPVARRAASASARSARPGGTPLLASFGDTLNCSHQPRRRPAAGRSSRWSPSRPPSPGRRAAEQRHAAGAAGAAAPRRSPRPGRRPWPPAAATTSAAPTRPRLDGRVEPGPVPGVRRVAPSPGPRSRGCSGPGGRTRPGGPPSGPRPGTSGRRPRRRRARRRRGVTAQAGTRPRSAASRSPGPPRCGGPPRRAGWPCTTRRAHHASRSADGWPGSTSLRWRWSSVGVEEALHGAELVVVDDEAALVQLGRRRHDLDLVVVAVEAGARVVVAQPVEQVRRREPEPLADPRTSRPPAPSRTSVGSGTPASSNASRALDAGAAPAAVALTAPVARPGLGERHAERRARAARCRP